ncbi:unnamed protein product, partial [marine sediment metagenome]
DEDKCYVEPERLRFLKNTNQFIWTSERSGWKERYLYDLSGKLIQHLTKARLPVGNIYAIDEDKGWIYFSGSENRGLETHLYKVKLDGTKFTKITKASGTHSANFSPGEQYYTHTFSSFEKPRKVTLHRADGTLLREIGKSIINQEFKDLKLQKPEHILFKSADGKYDLDGIVYKPANFDKTKKYPLIMSVYGGPGAKRIYNRFNLNDGNQALAQLGFIVFSIDHRGISRRGKAFKNLMYMNLGQIELEDHVAAVKHIIQRPYVDESRI